MSKNSIQLTGPNLKVDNTLIDSALNDEPSKYNFLFSSEPEAGPNRVLKAISLNTIFDYIKYNYLPSLVSIGTFYTSNASDHGGFHYYTLKSTLDKYNLEKYSNGFLVRFLVNSTSTNPVKLGIYPLATTGSTDNYYLLYTHSIGFNKYSGYSVVTSGKLLEGYYYEAVFIDNKDENINDGNPFFLLINEPNVNEVPVGGVIGYGNPRRTLNNNNYIKCDGSYLSVNNYKELFSIINYFYGSEENLLDPNNPNFKLPTITIGDDSVPTEYSTYLDLRFYYARNRELAVKAVDGVINFSAKAYIKKGDGGNDVRADVTSKINISDLPVPTSTSLNKFIISFKFGKDNGFVSSKSTYIYNVMVGSKTGSGNMKYYTSSNSKADSNLMSRSSSKNISLLSIDASKISLDEMKTYWSTGGWILSDTDPSGATEIDYNIIKSHSSYFDQNVKLKIVNCSLLPVEDSYNWNSFYYTGEYTSSNAPFYNGEYVLYNNDYYISLSDNNTSTLTTTSKWKKLTNSDSNLFSSNTAYAANSYVTSKLFLINKEGKNLDSCPIPLDFSIDRPERTSEEHIMDITNNPNSENWIVLNYVGEFNPYTQDNYNAGELYSVGSGSTTNPDYYIYQGIGNPPLPVNDISEWIPGYPIYYVVTDGVDSSQNPRYYYHIVNTTNWSDDIYPRSNTNDWSQGTYKTWSVNTQYEVGDIVSKVSNNTITYYVCYVSHTSDQSGITSDKWHDGGSHSSGASIEFDKSKYYKPNQIVFINIPYQSVNKIVTTKYATSKYNYNVSDLPYPINNTESYENITRLAVPIYDVFENSLLKKDSSRLIFIGFMKQVRMNNKVTTQVSNINLEYYTVKYEFLNDYNQSEFTDLASIESLTNISTKTVKVWKQTPGMTVIPITVTGNINIPYAYIKAR